MPRGISGGREVPVRTQMKDIYCFVEEEATRISWHDWGDEKGESGKKRRERKRGYEKEKMDFVSWVELGIHAHAQGLDIGSHS